MKCKIFGHNFLYYKEDVENQVYSDALSKSFSIVVNTNFRICERCYFKQVREHFTTRHGWFRLSGCESDWSISELGIEQSREKKLSKLGI
jgi:hypothetical protein